jgi:acetyl esterase/lipase
LYLPAGPVLEQASRPAFDDAIISALSASSNATVIRVNYRSGQGAPFPIPVHDVLAGYDWLIKFLADEDDANPQNIERRIGVCGQLFGGGMASSLALTEFRANQPQIVAAAVNNPITDWVVPDRERLEVELGLSDSDTALEEAGDRESDIAIERTKKRSKPKIPAASSWQQFGHSEILSTQAITKARNKIFTSENGYFDNFASPIHWFRTPGIEVAEDLARLLEHEEAPKPELLRKYRLNFPPTGSGLEMPHVRLSTGEESVLLTQNEEFLTKLNMAEVTNYLRARKIKYAKYKGLGQDDKNEVDFICDIADKKYLMNILPGVGLWGLGREEIWRQDVEGAGRWLRSLMLPP